MNEGQSRHEMSIYRPWWEKLRIASAAVIAACFLFVGMFALLADSDRRRDSKSQADMLLQMQKQSSAELKWHHVQVSFKHAETLKILTAIDRRLANVEKAIKMN